MFAKSQKFRCQRPKGAGFERLGHGCLWILRLNSQRTRDGPKSLVTKMAQNTQFTIIRANYFTTMTTRKPQNKIVIRRALQIETIPCHSFKPFLILKIAADICCFNLFKCVVPSYILIISLKGDVNILFLLLCLQTSE